MVFLAIYAFKDGNGRLSRIVTTLLLLRAGYGYVPYSSMEGIIEANKDNYYLALRRTQPTIRKEKQNWEYWLVFFLQTMAKQKDKLAAKVKEEQAMRSSLPALSSQILELAKTREEITGQGNRGFDGGEPQYHQGACEETGRGSLSHASRQRPRRTVYLGLAERASPYPPSVPRP